MSTAELETDVVFSYSCKKKESTVKLISADSSHLPICFVVLSLTYVGNVVKIKRSALWRHGAISGVID